MVLDASRSREMLEGVAGGVDKLSGKCFDVRSELRSPTAASVILELDPAT